MLKKLVKEFEDNMRNVAPDSGMIKINPNSKKDIEEIIKKTRKHIFWWQKCI